MASPAKSIAIILLILLALIGAGAYYLSSNLNGIVANLVETQGSSATQTAVRVDGIDIKLTDASASLSGLSVANPEGFAGNAIELGGFSATLDARSLTGDVITIKDITVEGARINVLQQGTRNNLRELLANLQAQAGSSTSTADEGSNKKLIIERFTLNGASASVSLPDLNQTSDVELPPIVISDIGKASNGATGAQIAQQLLKPVIQAAISSATAGALKDRVGEKLDKAVGGFLKGLSNKKDEE
ncbi:MAG: hypothetical protein AB8B57_15550 [Congregibacter sp.]